MKLPLLLVLPLLFCCPFSSASADPQLTSWFTAKSGQYARIYQSTAAETARTASSTWSRGSGNQASPTYAGLHQINYSGTWVYIRTTGLAGHIMGPWYLDPAKTQNFPNFPSNTAVTYRIPRAPVIPTTKTSTSGGPTGYMVNGVALFDSRDSFSYINASASDATPVSGGGTGDGIWNRDGYHNEGVSFDPSLAHQAGNMYHYHAHPVGLRYQLGDHMDYNATTNRYTESSGPVTRHSPILGWAADGLPVYGPYGYASALDATSALKRMVSGYVLRNGSLGSTHLASTGRTTLPAWAARVQGRNAALSANQYGPAVNATYALGHYIEDFDYLGDLGYTLGTHFDLNEQNVRYCVTPEYPAGTWAYFTPVLADGTPFYPYTTGRQYYATPSGGAVTSITETTTAYFLGGPNKEATAPELNVTGSNTQLTWSAIEGGRYQVEGTEDLVTWANVGSSFTAASDVQTVTDTGALTGRSRRIYRVGRSALATFDSAGFTYTQTGGGTSAVVPGGSVTRGSMVTVTITLPTAPPRPPVDRVPTGITLGGITGTTISRPDVDTVTATFVVPAGATAGAQTIIVTFDPAPTYTLTGAFTFN